MIARIVLGACILAPCIHEALAQPVSIVESERIRQPQRISLSENGARVAFVLGDTIFTRRPGSETRATALAGNMTRASTTERPFQALSPDGSRLVFLQGDGDRPRALLADLRGTPRLRPLLPDSLHQHLMLFRHFAGAGPSWSSDGRHLLFLASDVRTQEDLQVFLADAQTGALVRITKDRRMHWAATFAPNGQSFVVSASGDSAGTTTLDLFTRDGTYMRRLAIVASPYATDIRWSPNGAQLAVYTANGASLVYNVDNTGASPRTIRGRRFIGWSADGRRLIGTRRVGMSARLVSYELESGALTDLTTSDSTYSLQGIGAVRGTTVLAFLRESGNMPSDPWFATATASRLELEHRVTEANPFVAQSLPGASSTFRWQVDSGRTLEAQLFVPNTGLPAPLVVMTYGGYRNTFPSSEYFFDAGILPLLARGYAVVRPNTRGPASDAAVVGEYGSLQLHDTEKLIDSLASRGQIDARRVAVLGHSHGGSMAYYFATHSSRFCSVVAINGRADWEMQSRRGDPFLTNNMGGSPDSVPERYARDSPVRNAAQVTAPLLAVTGMLDTQIYPQNGRAMVDALRALGKNAELIEYATEGHLIAEQTHRVELWERVFGVLSSNCR